MVVLEFPYQLSSESTMMVSIASISINHRSAHEIILDVNTGSGPAMLFTSLCAMLLVKLLSEQGAIVLSFVMQTKSIKCNFSV